MTNQTPDPSSPDTTTATMRRPAVAPKVTRAEPTKAEKMTRAINAFIALILSSIVLFFIVRFVWIR